MASNSAYLLITCDNGKLDQVLEQLEHIHYIKEFQGTWGMYDIVAKIESQNEQQLQLSIIQQIRTIEGVKNAMTLECNPILQ